MKLLSEIFLHLPNDEELLGELNRACRQHILIKGQLIAQAGEVNDRLYYIEKGLVRGYYYADPDTLHTAWFETNGGFVTVSHSLSSRQQAIDNVEVLEDSTVCSFTHRDLQRIYASFPAAIVLEAEIVTRHIVEIEHRARILRCKTAKQRLLLFQEQYPDVYRRASLKHIASFLNMTPQTLSKIRSLKE